MVPSVASEKIPSDTTGDNNAAVKILSLNMSFKCSKTNRVVKPVRREFPDTLYNKIINVRLHVHILQLGITPYI
jgi:hypothetical protein